MSSAVVLTVPFIRSGSALPDTSVELTVDVVIVLLIWAAIRPTDDVFAATDAPLNFPVNIDPNLAVSAVGNVDVVADAPLTAPALDEKREKRDGLEIVALAVAPVL